MPAHFADEPAQVMGQADLDRANTKLEGRDEEKDNSDDGIANTSTNPANGATGEKLEKLGTYDKYELGEDDCYEELGFCFSNKKKWYIVTIIFWVQVSMNFNTSLYSNAIGGISEEFGVSAQGARCGAMIFLVTYAFGCELWAPWSEEFGRWPILQLSMFLVNIWQLPVALAPNFATIMVGRALGGLSTAGGSVTLALSLVPCSVLSLVDSASSISPGDGASGSSSSSAASSKPSTSLPSPRPAQQSC